MIDRSAVTEKFAAPFNPIFVQEVGLRFYLNADGELVFTEDGLEWDPETQTWVEGVEGEMETFLPPLYTGLDLIGGAPTPPSKHIPKHIVFPVPGKTASWGPVGAKNPQDATYTTSTGDHEGVDIFAKAGTPVVAPVDGTVVRIVEGVVNNTNPDGSDNDSWGNLIVIRDSCGNFWFLAHLSSVDGDLKEGDTVSAGDEIAKVGRTGAAYKDGKGASHLHVGINPNAKGGDRASTAGSAWDRWYYPWYFLGQFGHGHK